jgi:SAM-dependent methyltransferase
VSAAAVVREDLPTERAPVRAPYRWGTQIYDQRLFDALWSERARVRGVVVDLGCGMKPYESWLGAGASRWLGVDRPASASGRPKADAFADAGAVPLRSGIADCVISTQVIEHVPRPWEVFAEAARLMRPGASLIVTAPQAQWLHEEPHDYYRYTKYGLMELARAAGLEPVRVVPFGGAIALIGFLLASHVPTLGGREGSLWVQVQRSIQAVIQWSSGSLDRLITIRGDTVGNMLVAIKP